MITAGGSPPGPYVAQFSGDPSEVMAAESEVTATMYQPEEGQCRCMFKGEAVCIRPDSGEDGLCNVCRADGHGQPDSGFSIFPRSSRRRVSGRDLT